MVAIESTSEMAAAVYAMMARNLAVVRRRLGKPLTLADKILLGHLDDPEHQEIEPGKSYLLLRPDRVVFQDVLGQTGLLQFMQTRREKVAVPATIHCDHLIQARVEGMCHRCLPILRISTGRRRATAAQTIAPIPPQIP